MHIGSLKLSNNVILAPLAGITNLPFRLLAKKAGCSLVCSEMVSANGLVHKSAKTRQLMQSTPVEKPLSIQIFGSDPAIMAEAASIVAATGADIIDINFGCSVKKIVRNGAGAALMETPHKAEALIKAVRNAIAIPLTIKIRTGWEKSGAQALKLSEIAEACGVDAVTVHPRTATQGFSGQADRTVIAAVKQKLKIPVIGNGDIQTADDAVKMLNETGCDAVMIGRRAIGYPWIFSEVLARQRGQGESTADPSRRFDMMRQYLQASVTYCGEELACRMMRSRLSWFSKGMRNSSKFRESIKRISSQAEAEELITKYQESIEE
jgi:tRNA-dihydrouridine synthase B